MTQLAARPDHIPQPSAGATLRHEQHLRYVQKVSDGSDALISQETGRLAREAWLDVWKASKYAIDVPAACTGPDGEMFYAWDNGDHHFELEIIHGKPAEFFYRNRETEEIWGEDYNIGEPLSDAVIQKLKLVTTNA